MKDSVDLFPMETGDRILKLTNRHLVHLEIILIALKWGKVNEINRKSKNMAALPIPSTLSLVAL